MNGCFWEDKQRNTMWENLSPDYSFRVFEFDVVCVTDAFKNCIKIIHTILCLAQSYWSQSLGVVPRHLKLRTPQWFWWPVIFRKQSSVSFTGFLFSWIKVYAWEYKVFLLTEETHERHPIVLIFTMVPSPEGNPKNICWW